VSPRIQLILKSSSFRVVQTCVGIIVGFLMMPFLVRTLGEELYGIWVVVGSLVGTYYLLDLGFNQAVTRYVSRYIHQGNVDAANRVINTALILYTSLGLVVLLASFAIAALGVDRVMDNADQVSLVQILIIVSGLTLALEFPAKSFPGVISAYLRYDVIAVIRLSKTILDAMLIYIFLSRGYGLVSMAVITLCTGVVSTWLYVYYARGLFSPLKFSRSFVDKSTLTSIYNFSKWVFVVDVSNMLRGKMDIWFIAFFQSSAVLTVYYVAVRLTEYALQLLTQATGITEPIFTEYYARDEHEKLKESVVAFIKINIALGSLVLTGFYLLGESFIRLWMGAGFPVHEAFSCLVLLVLGRLAVYFSTPLQSLLLTINRHSISAWISLAETAGMALLLYWLVPAKGIVGASLAVVIPVVIGKLIATPLAVARYIDLNMPALIMRTVIFAALVASVIAAGAAYFPQLESAGLLQLPLYALVIVIIHCILSSVLFDSRERRWIRMLLRREH